MDGQTDDDSIYRTSIVSRGNNLVKFGMLFLKDVSRQTGKETDEQTYKQTALLCTPMGVK